MRERFASERCLAFIFYEASRSISLSVSAAVGGTFELGLPKELRRALACTNIVENVMATVRRVCRNVKRRRSASMALRWTAAAMREAAKGFRRLKAHKQLPTLRAALQAHQMNTSTHDALARQTNAA
jgi:putative transposase